MARSTPKMLNRPFNSKAAIVGHHRCTLWLLCQIRRLDEVPLAKKTPDNETRVGTVATRTSEIEVAAVVAIIRMCYSSSKQRTLV